MLGPKVLRERSHYPLIVALVGAFLCSLLLFNQVRVAQESSEPEHAGYSRTVTLWTWAVVPNAYDQPPLTTNTESQLAFDGGLRDLRLDVTLRADALTCVMLSMVTFVSTLVAFFAVGYMHGDRGYWRFFAYFALFVFSMTMLVSCSNFVLLFVFWEAVGLCSYLLIGFWYEKPEAAAAGKKAFLVNRVGDFGFTLALFLIWMTYGTLNFHDSLTNGTTDNQALVAALESQGGGAQSEIVHGVLGRWRIASGAYVGGTVGFADLSVAVAGGMWQECSVALTCLAS